MKKKIVFLILISVSLNAQVERYNQSRDRASVLEMIKKNAAVFVDAAEEDAQEGSFELDFGQKFTLKRTIYVYREGNKTVGFISYLTMGDENPMGMIARLAILPEYCKKGFAQALIKQAMQDLQKQNKKAVLVTFVEGNTPAERLYEKVGFEKVAEAPGQVVYGKQL
ncbi:MAG TPA: GNAT family N-acetyltransferase [Candidatus Babeliales bacterium]|nr:GNAT family N-acetyltransferase [Candidatus Babeliales bacterium]